MLNPGGCESARIIFVIETKTARGSGLTPEDPVRIVTEYWTLTGDKLAEVDPIVTGEDAQS